jgi:hypothetical protein
VEALLRQLADHRRVDHGVDRQKPPDQLQPHHVGKGDVDDHGERRVGHDIGECPSSRIRPGDLHLPAGGHGLGKLLQAGAVHGGEQYSIHRGSLPNSDLISHLPEWASGSFLKPDAHSISL